ncbi:hypothetical protein DL765_010904 [Monosporascus sp. GIB2]|nr:hypothetical protein DL765_010904 [Monosporascus sp. GIB2]
MHDPFGAPQDPAFWVHHSSTDRVWAMWQAGGAPEENRGEQWDGTDIIPYDRGNPVGPDTVMHLGPPRFHRP